MFRKFYYVVVLLVYLCAYYEVRKMHWLIHTLSYGFGSKPNTVIIVKHAVRNGDYAIFSHFIFYPVTLIETAYWTVIQPPGSELTLGQNLIESSN